MKTKITFAGGAGTVTGANFLFDTGNMRFLVDCGLTHGHSFCELENHTFSYDPATVDVLIVTHAHADHIGRIPYLVKEGFRGVIYSTPATRDITEVMLADALKIMRMEARKDGCAPLYDAAHIAEAMQLWQTKEYHEVFAVGDGVQASFHDAGHILGSAMVRLQRAGKVFVCTGDLGNSPEPLLCDTEPVTDADYILTESVYGDRNHEGRSERTEKLRAAILDAIEHRRTLLIPTFALERAQILLYEINNLVEGGVVPAVPVYLDAPLATRVTEIFKNYAHLFNKRAKQAIVEGDDVFSFPHFEIVREQVVSRKLHTQPSPKVIIASSGMSVGGRILAHEKTFLEDPNNSILFIGYQAVGTVGRAIYNQKEHVWIDGKKVQIRANVSHISGYSGHKDRDHIIEFIGGSAKTLKKVFIAMGEPRSSQSLAETLHAAYNVEAVAPAKDAVETVEF